jgi:hypothetical protein
LNAIPIIALSVLLTAGGALAQSSQGSQSSQSKKKNMPQLPESPLTEADRPKTCDDQCKVLEKIMVDPCKKGAGTNKQAQQMCSQNAKQVVDACYGSCREKGKVDKQYVMERIKPPPGYKAAQEAAAKANAQGGAKEESHGDAH